MLCVVSVCVVSAYVVCCECMCCIVCTKNSNNYEYICPAFASCLDELLLIKHFIYIFMTSKLIGASFSLLTWVCVCQSTYSITDNFNNIALR